jgi:hypothetical protein
MQDLLSCDGVGVMALAAAACPDRYLSETSAIPPEELDFDVRGRIDAIKHSGFAYIDTGEIKSRLAYGDAIPQLGLRLRCLKYLMSSCGIEGLDPGMIRCVGRLFVRERAIRQGGGGPPRKEEDDAQHDWGFSLYLHILD